MPAYQSDLLVTSPAQAVEVKRPRRGGGAAVSAVGWCSMIERRGCCQVVWTARLPRALFAWRRRPPGRSGQPCKRCTKPSGSAERRSLSAASARFNRSEANSPSGLPSSRWRRWSSRSTVASISSVVRGTSRMLGRASLEEPGSSSTVSNVSTDRRYESPRPCRWAGHRGRSGRCDGRLGGG